MNFCSFLPSTLHSLVYYNPVAIYILDLYCINNAVFFCFEVCLALTKIAKTSLLLLIDRSHEDRDVLPV